MGRVVEATDTLLGRGVAIKEALATDPESLRRFVRETNITARLEHPAIVPVYDAGTTPGGAPFYVMRKVTGQPLDERVRATVDLRGRLALVPHVAAAAAALAHAHARGVIHRDVKPQNILVGDLGETVVIDWGLAKVTGEPDEPVAAEPLAPLAPLAGDSLRTQIGIVFGTPGFMAPEQVMSSDVDARADVYALGATLYYVLARRAPHAAPTGTEMMAAAGRGPPLPLGSRVRGVPAELVTIVDKALAFAEADRYPHAGALAEDLQRFLTGQLVAAHRYSAAARVRRFVRRHRGVVIAVTVAVAALVIGGVVAVGRVVEARDEALAQARAAEAARGRETERADDLVLSEARLILDHDPTGAVALVRPLATGPRWREVHAIAAGARAAGVAWRLPGPATVDLVAMAPDGAHAASLDFDGTIRVYDLAAHTMRPLATLHGSPVALAFVDDSRLAAVTSNDLDVIAVASGRVDEVSADSPAQLGIAAGRLTWVDADGHGWRLDPGAREPAPLGVADALRATALSPDGTRVAACGAHGLWLASVGPAVRVLPTPCGAIAWADDGHRLAVTTATDVLVVALDAPGRAPAATRRPFARHTALALVGEQLYTIGRGGLALDGRIIESRDDLGELGLVRAGATAIIAAISEGSVTVVDGDQLVTLTAPVRNLTSVAAARGSHRVIAAASGSVFVWDADDVLARALPFGQACALLTSAADHQLYAVGDGIARWIDLATGAQVPAPFIDADLSLVPSPTSAQVLAGVPHGRGYLLAAGGPQQTPVGDDFHVGELAAGDRVVIGTNHGELAAFDAAGGKRVLARFPAGEAVILVQAAGHWVVAEDRGHALARVDLDAPGSASTLPATPGLVAAVIASDGRTAILHDQDVFEWTADGRRVPLVTLPGPLDMFATLDGDHALARAATTAGYVVDLRAGTYAAAGDLPISQLGVSPATQLAVVPTVRGARILDLATHASWTFAADWAASSLLPGMSRDGRYVFAPYGRAIYVWGVDVPQSAAATARWIGTLTNAHWDAATHAPGW